MDCPNENTLAAYADGGLALAHLETLKEHISSCDDCRELALALGSESLEAPPSGQQTVAGSRRAKERAETGASGLTIGRFEVLRELGRGGMGVVHEAHDPTLDRRVAIKLVRGGTGGLRADARDRLLREARSLARLTHKNVVPVYEAGLHDGELYLAMELIDGEPLDAWLKQNRDWRDIVRVFALAGEGLHAAHESDLVHRDFKPSNLMVSGGDVKVVDFGLARAASFESDLDEALDEKIDPERLTITGGFVGTPAYAAPEQLRGTEATPRSDIFSFSVTLFEALTGKRPFSGTSRASLLESIDAGVSAESIKRLPPKLRKIVGAGLRADPKRRPTSLSVFIATLRESLKPRRGKVLVAGAAAAGIGAVALGLFVFLGRAGDQCGGAEGELRGLWDIPARAAIATAMLDSGSPIARERLIAVSAVLDDYTERWVEARTQACQATARSEQSPELLDLRLACYRRRLADVREATSLLVDGEPETVTRSIDLVSGLPSLEECAATERLLARDRGHANDPQAERELEAMISSAEARDRAGQFEAGLEFAQKAAEQAKALDDPNFTWRANEVLAILHVGAGNFDLGVAAFKTALFAAVASKDSEAEARIAADLARELTFNRPDESLARNYAEHARAALRRVEGAEDRALALVGLSGHYYNVNDLAQALEATEEALSLTDRIEQPKQKQVRAAAMLIKGSIANEKGELENALSDHRESLRLYTDAFGLNHEYTVTAGEAVANSLRRLGRFDEAHEQFRIVWKARETLAGAANELAMIQVAALASEDPAEIEKFAREAVTVSTRLYGANHPSTGAAHEAHADALGTLERWDESLVAARRAVEIASVYEHAEPGRLGVIYLSLASAQHETKDYEGALESSERANALIASSEFDEPINRFLVLISLVDTLTTQKRWNLACPKIDELAVLLPTLVVGGELEQDFLRIGQAVCAWELRGERAAIGRVATLIEKVRGKDPDLDSDLPEFEEWLKGARRGKRTKPSKSPKR